MLWFHYDELHATESLDVEERISSLGGSWSGCSPKHKPVSKPTAWEEA